MTSAQSKNHARSFLQKAQEYLASAHDNRDLERATPAAGDAIHAGISAKDAIVPERSTPARTSSAVARPVNGVVRVVW
ncbi:hypothetical protein [Nocardioides sp. YIM 152315]|uniref:hypothetical protein n=1 Tax=Nocardioides sp. YIM 152315 TaxID=3031760 RepID=UPI0023D9918A|nr:hypothetical protein [Nocardioides sp. YIM 152315]MDF1605464.1 hypothetical protein [Nocardioides sp. YIM 152315]